MDYISQINSTENDFLYVIILVLPVPVLVPNLGGTSAFQYCTGNFSKAPI